MWYFKYLDVVITEFLLRESNYASFMEADANSIASCIFIARDAVFINPTGAYEGADAIRESLAGLNADGITFKLSNFRNSDGTVVYGYEVLQASNVLDRGTNGLTMVRDGKIVFDGTEDTAP